MKVGLYAGSFDPVHLGHMDLIATASERLDRLVVVVAANPQKQTGMFLVPERVQMLEGARRHLANVDVVAADARLLIDVADRVRADVLVRSAGKEHVAEKQMAYMNRCDGLPTLLVPSDPKTAFISSSQVRSLIALGAFDAIAEFVPPAVTDVVKALRRKAVTA